MDSSEPAVLSDLTIGKSKSLEKQRQAAVSCFSTFLHRLNQYENEGGENIFTAYDPALIPRSYLENESLFGKYASFMVEKNFAQSTFMGYFSQIKKQLMSDYPGISEFFDLENHWWEKMKKNVKATMLHKCQEEGSHVVDSAPAMTEVDLSLIVGILAAQDKEVSYGHRCLLTWQWQAMGRITEIAELSLDHLNFAESGQRSTIEFRVVRTKIDTHMAAMSAFFHSSNWQLCPIHSLAAHLALRQNGIDTDKIFPHLSKTDRRSESSSGEAAYANRILNSVTNDVIEPVVTDVGSLRAKKYIEL